MTNQEKLQQIYEAVILWKFKNDLKVVLVALENVSDGEFAAGCARHGWKLELEDRAAVAELVKELLGRVKPVARTNTTVSTDH